MTPEQLCETQQKKRDQQKTVYARRKETEKGGAHEINPVWGDFDPICQQNLSSAATSAIGPKRGNEEVDANRWENEGLRTRRKVYLKTPEQLCETKQKKRDQQKAAYTRRKEKGVAFERSLTPEQLCETQQKKGINKKQSMLKQRRKGLPWKGL